MHLNIKWSILNIFYWYLIGKYNILWKKLKIHFLKFLSSCYAAKEIFYLKIKFFGIIDFRNFVNFYLN